MTEGVESMRIVFMGTPEFAVPSLEALIGAGYEVVGAVTQPDRPVGRKGKLTPPPVKVCAQQHGIPVLQFERIRRTEGREALEALKNGQVDCVILDNEPAKALVAANEGLHILDTEYAVEDYAIAIAKENTDLLDKINTALAELKDDGTLQSIVDKYIGE